MPLVIRQGYFCMITYIATNTKTGKFYIGSAKNYCRYMARVGTHHISKCGYPFQTDLQADPESFKWEWYEDDLTTRDWERALIALYIDSPYCYNIGEGRWQGRHLPRSPRSEETKQKIREGALRDRDRRVKGMRELSSSKEPCPHCGKLMNPGNLKQHLRAQTCLKTLG
jgi:hypothetical protein